MADPAHMPQLADDLAAFLMDSGRDVLTLEADVARERYVRIHARFASPPGTLQLPGARIVRQQGREAEIVAAGGASDLLERLKARFDPSRIFRPGAFVGGI